jgi:hypothetical protein
MSTSALTTVTAVAADARVLPGGLRWPPFDVMVVVIIIIIVVVDSSDQILLSFFCE